MRNYLIGLTLFLAACAGGAITAQSVVDWVKANCGIIVQLVDIAAVLSGQPGVVTAAQIGGQICEAVKTQRADQLKAAPASPPVGGVVVINNVPVHWSVQ